jgi:feruloyl esterase
LTLAGLCFIAASAATAQTGNLKCAALNALDLPSAKITSASIVPAAASLSGIRLPPALAARLPAFCRVRITDRPSPDSDINIELWLPVDGWNGRFRGTGNGGFAGVIYFTEMAAAVTEGYATAGTDTGHAGAEPDFALGHPEKVVDFGWRAVHDMTVASKTVLAAFYGKPPAHSYFASCSDGGREALMEAERFPADYDGILAGAPAYNWTGLVTAGMAKLTAMKSSPDRELPAAKVPAIAAAVRAACDAKDGVKDGVLNDPRTCGFDPATMLCKDGDAKDCLTPGQVATLKNFYTPVKDPSGKEIMPGMLPGAEDGGNGWASWITGTPGHESLGEFFAQGFFRNFVHEQANWTFHDFDLAKDTRLAIDKTAAALNATDTNLKPFSARGGKLILYHGWNDPAIPALSTVKYFDGLRQTLGAKATDDSTRLYMVPGMQHCGGGPGANDFGQSGTNARADAQHDVFTALEQWVEAGNAPGPLVAKKYLTDNPAKGVEFTRPLCPYPAAAKYVSGDTNDAKSFICAKP